MSYFELSLLAGLALGGVVGAQLWRIFHTNAFGTVASVYLVAAALLHFGTASSKGRGGPQAPAGFWHALRQPSLRRLAPVWLCVNTIVGLWLGPTLTFLLTQKAQSAQFLAGVLAYQPERVGWLRLGYSLIFGAGVTAYSVILPRMPILRVLRMKPRGDVRSLRGVIFAESFRRPKLRHEMGDQCGIGLVCHDREWLHSRSLVSLGWSD